MKSICVFCGSNAGANPMYAEAARELGAALANHGLGLIYGGGNVGLMGVLADAALERGAQVIGVIPQSLMDKELAHGRLTRLHIVHSMHERKALMAELADAFVALPGGYGTLEEFCEMLTWAQLGLHRKPCGLLNVEGFYEPLLAQIDRAVKARFIRAEHRSLFVVEQHAERLVARLLEFRPPAIHKWISADET